MTAKVQNDRPRESLWRQFGIQRRVIWALVMRETITMYGREGLGVLWIIAEPAMFVIGVMIIFSYIEAGYANGVSVAEYMAVSYPTLLFWRNGTGRVTKAIDINRSLLHHQLIRPMDILYARIILTFASGAAAFMVLYPIFTFLGITHLPAHWFAFGVGYFLVIWFSFAFVLIMAALAELSETIEKNLPHHFISDVAFFRDIHSHVYSAGTLSPLSALFSSHRLRGVFSPRVFW